MAQSIYEKYGGFGAVNRIVMSFYDSVLDHDEIGEYFDGIEMKSLIDHQTNFIASLLGGPASFSDEHLRRAHAQLSITPSDFDAMKRLLEETLLEHDIEPEDVATVISAIEARRPMVLAS